MPLTNLDKAPFPWFGGKRHAAPLVWEALGDVAHYVEPFAGSLAVLLCRPHTPNRAYHSETVNDMDAIIVNAWRAIQADPDAVADAASWPVSEVDLMARQLALIEWRQSEEVERLRADPRRYNAEMAGWWVWGVSGCIGIGAFASGDGPWVVGEDGKVCKRGRPGVGRGVPHLTGNGRGVNHAGAREPGVSRELPHLGDNGRGVNRPQAREPGVRRRVPHVGDNGRGVNRPQAREPGVSRELPHLVGDGQGVNRPQAREPGVRRRVPHVGDNGHGVNHAGAREPGVAPDVWGWSPDTPAEFYHPHTMPEVRRWMAFLSARLRHVRILQGDWARLCTNGVMKTINVRMGDEAAGVFLDPPYSTEADRAMGVYAHDCGEVAHAVRAWCLERGDDPKLRIVLAGYDTEHDTEMTAAGWRSVPWFKAGFLRGGMGNTAHDGTHQQHRERLWLSPHCLRPEDDAQTALFG